MERRVSVKVQTYPDDAKRAFIELRDLIFNLAEKTNSGRVSESLKWNEPSYTVKAGSPIRIDWKEKKPANIYLFFNCQTSLVETFREVYPHALSFEGNRAIVIDLAKPLPIEAITQCILLALTYHNVKNLPLLGV
ncbi:hypothetical protein CS022_04500 [Veronia nyctiphanis]|uniref:YdhG-like domain-containing protein n=1 Tax=Veronia nyctiphanis TaxID=1278244 RepID=A0A4Q0YT00_9GAMM|nr:DUF1801 domain-containing protein [Veronia nyctiphanis]RXJ74316.1 hypothetical protein CS022_04500 [Veronia nyctiphanis]